MSVLVYNQYMMNSCELMVLGMFARPPDIDRQMDRRADGQIDRWLDGRTDARANGRTLRLTHHHSVRGYAAIFFFDSSLLQSIIIPTVLWPCQLTMSQENKTNSTLLLRRRASFKSISSIWCGFLYGFTRFFPCLHRYRTSSKQTNLYAWPHFSTEPFHISCLTDCYIRNRSLQKLRCSFPASTEERTGNWGLDTGYFARERGMRPTENDRKVLSRTRRAT